MINLWLVLGLLVLCAAVAGVVGFMIGLYAGATAHHDLADHD